MLRWNEIVGQQTEYNDAVWKKVDWRDGVWAGWDKIKQGGRLEYRIEQRGIENKIK